MSNKYNTIEWKNALGMAQWCKSDKCTVEQIAQDEYAVNKTIDRLYEENKKLKGQLEYLLNEHDRLQRKIDFEINHCGFDFYYDKIDTKNFK